MKEFFQETPTDPKLTPTDIQLTQTDTQPTADWSWVNVLGPWGPIPCGMWEWWRLVGGCAWHYPM